jgi:hypothetical protein
MSVSEFDLVRITRSIPATRVHRCRTRVYPTPTAGEVATVVFAYPVTLSHAPLFMVECVQLNGERRWLADVYSLEMERIAAQQSHPLQSPRAANPMAIAPGVGN